MTKRPKSPTERAIKPQHEPTVRVLRLDDDLTAETQVDDAGLSLEDLGQAYAAVLNRGTIPYEDESPAKTESSEDSAPDRGVVEGDPLPTPPSDVDCDLSPQSILEAMLFVGHPQSEPLTAKHVASLMRGVLPEEIDDLVRDLNEQYAAEGCPYLITSTGPGYRMELREEFSSVREHFYGRLREAKLSQGAIDALAIIAYHQPVGLKEIEQLRGKPSGGILGQLVGRQLIKLERNPEKPRESKYRTTLRFLDLFGIDSLDDLPRSAE